MVLKKVPQRIPKIQGGGSRPFGLFPNRRRFFYVMASLSQEVVDLNREIRILKEEIFEIRKANEIKIKESRWKVEAKL